MLPGAPAGGGAGVRGASGAGQDGSAARARSPDQGVEPADHPDRVRAEAARPRADGASAALRHARGERFTPGLSG
ncbi:hypothetical protein AQJ43_30995 [Streptomyces avermitilis]|nr:hypothetical protein AQJ43_30995 [Streptomyces avermitilis]OOV24169.1 hypothetical protein SM007_30640 [Streptomyces avermitilis]